jgi:hypothetical protein
LAVTWATDFFTEEVWTLGGLVTFYVLFFIHLGSRRVWPAGCTPQPHPCRWQQFHPGRRSVSRNREVSRRG